MHYQVGNCPKCGAPIYSPSVWGGVTPAPVTYSCACHAPTTLITTTNTQPAPQKNTHPHVSDELIKDILERKAKGMETYGTPLQPFNGRDGLQDLFEELLDAVQYLKQVIMERDNNNGL